MASSVMDPQTRMKKTIEWSTQKISIDKRLPIRLYFRSGREILRQANIYVTEGDDEKAFQLYFRFVSLYVERISEHPEYKTTDPGEKLFFKNQCKEVLSRLEKIKKRLLSKYQEEYDKYLEEETTRQAERDRFSQTFSNNLSNNDVTDFRRSDVDDTELRFKKAQEKLSALSLKNLTTNEDVMPSAPEFLPEPLRDISPIRYKRSEPPAHPPPFNPLSSQKDKNILPTIDRTTKPSQVFTSLEPLTGKLRRVVIPSSISSDFLKAASSNTSKNVETCGILCGKLQQNVFAITHVLIPKQKGTSDSCLTQNEEDVFIFQDQHDLTTLGWIHTHPSQSAFMSSIDLHTHFAYQVMLPEAIAIVCAPKFGDTGIFSLSDFGLDYIANCSQTGFHPHPNESLLYETSPHVHLEQYRTATFVDLR